MQRSSTDAAAVAPAVHVEDLRKSFGTLHAVRGITFDVAGGEIFGLIGPDGAGKTTTFHLLAGVMEPAGGSVTVLGRHVREAHAFIGYLTQQFSLHLDLSVNENVRYVAGLRRLPPSVLEENRRRYLGLTGLERFGDRLARQLSGGMKQKLALVCALVCAPTILLLDEPTTGLDPISRRELWDVFAALAAGGVTIVVATPYLDEAERCHRVALMYDGRIEQLGTPGELRGGLELERLEIRPNGALRATERVLAGFGDVQTFGDRIDVLTPDAARDESRIRLLLAEHGIAPKSIERAQPTLENAFIADLRRYGTTRAAPPFPRTLHPQRNTISTVAIEARALCKRFSTFDAVRSIDLTIAFGEIYGLLGANGAGKTTTIKMLCGLLRPSSGRVRIAGTHGNLRSRSVRQRIGYMSQKFTLYDDLTIGENLDFYCGVYGIPPALRQAKIDWALTSTGLQGHEREITRSLPGGWKQRLAFGACVLHEPEILFLDEPTSGVDPAARREFWRLIEEFARSGAAVLVTTHYLDEAEHCNRVGFMSAGTLATEGSPSQIKAAQPGEMLELAVSDAESAREMLATALGARRVSVFGKRLRLALDDPERELPRVRALLGERGIAIDNTHPVPFTLEDAFINVVSEANAG